MTLIIPTAQQAKAEEIVATRQRAKADGLFLGQLLGYDFQPDVHADLFKDTYDPKVPLYDQAIPKQELLLWPRGHYKTTARVVQAIQLVLNFPDIRILLMQGTVKNTQGWLAEIKSHFTGENTNSKLREYFPEFCANKLGTKNGFTVRARTRTHLRESTFTVASRKSVKAGLHFDCGFFDDLVNEQNFRNPDIVEQVTQDFNHATPLIDPGGFKRVSGTRYTFGDLYEQIIRRNQGEWVISLKTCWKPGTDKEPLFPQRTTASGRKIGFTRELLEQIEREDPETFSAQYLNNPISAQTHLFPDTLIVSKVRAEKDVMSLSPAILFVDLASSRRSEADHSVVIAGKSDALGRMYVADVAGDRYHVAALAEAVIAMAMKHRPLRILIENTSAAKYFVEYLRVLARDRNILLPLDYIKIDNTKDAKFLRISGLKAFIDGNRLFFLAGIPRWDLIVEQFAQFPKGRHDDYPDTISLMVKHFSEKIPAVRPAGAMDWLFKVAEPVSLPFNTDRLEHAPTFGGAF